MPVCPDAIGLYYCPLLWLFLYSQGVGLAVNVTVLFLLTCLFGWQGSSCSFTCLPCPYCGSLLWSCHGYAVLLPLCPSRNLSRLSRTLEISVRTSWWCFWPMRYSTTLLSWSSFGRPHSWPSLGPNLEHSFCRSLALLPHICSVLTIFLVPTFVEYFL